MEVWRIARSRFSIFPELGVTQGHWKWYQSIQRMQLAIHRWTHRRSWGRCWSNGWTGLCSDECCRRRGCSCDQALKQHNNHMPLIQLLMQHQLQSAYRDMVDHSIQWRHVYYYEGMQSMTWLRPCLPTNKCCTMRTNDGNYVCQSATLCLEVDIMVQLLYM